MASKLVCRTVNHLTSFIFSTINLFKQSMRFKETLVNYLEYETFTPCLMFS